MSEEKALTPANGNGHSPTKWYPNPKQTAFIQAYADEDFNQTISALCLQIGVARSTFYDWMKDPEFEKMFLEAPFQRIKHNVPGMISAQIKRALLGDLASFNALMELVGKSPTAQQAITNVFIGAQGNPAPLNLDNLDTEDRKLVEIFANLCARIASRAAGPNGAGNGSR